MAEADSAHTQPNPIDIHVGSRLKLRRNLLGISQEKLAAALNLTFQQVQKYERGTNRIGASRLYQISRLLEVPVTFFYDGLDAVQDYGIQQTPAFAVNEGKEAYQPEDPLTRGESLELIYWYYRLHDAEQRQLVLNVIKNMVRTTTGAQKTPA